MISTKWIFFTIGIAAIVLGIYLGRIEAFAYGIVMLIVSGAEAFCEPSNKSGL
jgi:hypothetical protein